MIAALLCPAAGSAAESLRPGAIENAHRYSKSGPGLGMIVWEKGEIRFEDYYNGHSADRSLHIYSGTKSFFGVLAAIGVEDGWLDLDEPVADILPEWRSDPRKSRIRVRDLLDFTSGLEKGVDQIYGRSSADKVSLSVGLDTEADRGRTFIYGPSHLQVFCAVLRKKLESRGTTYPAMVQHEILAPLGIRVTTWRDDDHGNPYPSAGMYMTGRDWLKFGIMVVNGGQGNGQRILRSSSLEQCFRGTGINPAFGLTFWLNAYAPRPDARVVDVEEWLDREPMPRDWRRVCLSKDAPADLVVSLGSNFQRLYIVPSMQLAVVHLGKRGGKGFRDEEFLRLLFEGTGAGSPKITDKGNAPGRSGPGFLGLRKLFRKDR